jgi:hypothetical protein
MALWLLALGCGGDLSNQVFLDDAAFLAALPSREQLEIFYTEDFDEALVVEDPTDLFALTVSAVEGSDGYLASATALTDSLRTLAPAVREADYREWGPHLWDAYPDYYILAEMSRSTSGAAYTYKFFVSSAASGDSWYPLLSGHYYIGETVEEGDGSVTWDLATLGGRGALLVEYDLRDALAVRVTLEDVRFPGTEVAEPANAVWVHQRTDDGGGELEYTAWLDANGDAENTPERWDVFSRWLADGSGRGDTRISEGDLGDQYLEGFQCWSPDGALTAQASNSDAIWPEVGDAEEGCPWTEAAELGQLE